MAILTPPTMPQVSRLSPSSRRGRNLFRPLLDWCPGSRFGAIEAATLTLFAIALARAIPRHELWADEVQAWYLATDNSLYDTLRHRMHYEGAPALWHVILHLFHALGGTVFGMSWLGAALAAAGVFVFLRWSPFPLLLRILIPFTFFFAYQYAVIARGYNMFALLCFGLCALYTRPRHSAWFMIVAGLLANLSLQGAIAAFLFVALYLFDLKTLGIASQIASPFEVGSYSGTTWRATLRPALLFLPFLLLAGIVALPAPDVNFAIGNQVSDGPVHRLLVRFPGEFPRTLPTPPPDPPLPPPAPERPEPHFSLLAPGPWLGWYPYHHFLDADGNPLPLSVTQSATEFLFGSAAQATWPIASSRLLACVFLAVWLCWLRSMRFLRGALVWLALILIGQILWVLDHHAGMILIVLISITWIARVRHHLRPFRAPVHPQLDRAFVLLFALVALGQIQWTYTSMRNDLRGSYSPGRDTAQVLQHIAAQHPGARFAGFDSLVATVQPYFDRNPFFNLPQRYWLWTNTDSPLTHHQATIATHPDAVVLSWEDIDPGLMHNTWAPLSVRMPLDEELNLTRSPIAQDLQANGYVETHRFCGHRFSRNSSSFEDCHIIFEPTR